MKKLHLLLVLTFFCQQITTSAQSFKKEKNPLELKVVEKEDVKTISWSTAKEENTSCFIIEKAIGNLPFEIIAIVKADGDSDVPNYYEVLDTDTSRTRARYKVSLVTVSGKIKIEVDHLFIPE